MSSTLLPPARENRAPGKRIVSVLKGALRSREIGVLAALAVLVIVVSILRYPSFLTATNMFNLTRQIAFTAIVAIGVLFVILTGGVDLSLGSTVGVTGFLCAVAITMWHAPPLLATLVGVATGAAVGAFHGAVVSYIGVTPFIVTLGMLTIGRSIIYQIFNGANITDVPDVFSAVANGSTSDIGSWMHSDAVTWAFSHLVPRLPIPVVILLLVALGCHIVLAHTVFGRRIYAIGGNEEATELSGINVRAVKFFTYVICSSLCSITGLLYVGRFRSAVANAGVGLELDAIAAAVIGGTSLMGGTGSVLGVVIGACIMGVVSNAITLLEIKSEAQGTIIGGIIIAAAILDVMRTRKTSPSLPTQIFLMGLVSAALLFGDFWFVDWQVRELYYPLAAALSASVILAATLFQYTSRPALGAFLQFARFRVGARGAVVCLIALLFLIYLFFVNVFWGIGLISVVLGLYLIIAGFAALIQGRPAHPQRQRILWRVLAAAGALLCLYFTVILAQDFHGGRTILNAQRISTLLIIATVGANAGLMYAAIRSLLVTRLQKSWESP